MVLLIATTNYVRAVWPLTVADNDRARIFADYALATLPRDACVVATVGGATTLIAARLGAASVFIVPHSPGARGTARILTALRAFVEAGWADGRPVWVFGNLLEPPTGRLADPVFRAEATRLLERLRTEEQLSVLPTDRLARPMLRHPWDVSGS